MKIKLSAKEAEDAINENHADWKIVLDKVVDNSRWTIEHEAVLLHIPSNKHYITGYSRGATEYQDSPMFYDNEVEFIEVEHKEVLVKKWIVVD